MRTGVAGQVKGNFEFVSISQGLSEGMVFDMIQRNEGFIPAAIKKGLTGIMVMGPRFFPTIHTIQIAWTETRVQIFLRFKRNCNPFFGILPNQQLPINRK
jgi:hypothetical protein